MVILNSSDLGYFKGSRLCKVNSHLISRIRKENHVVKGDKVDETHTHTLSQLL